MKNNHLFPFLWLRGEERDLVAEEIDRIYSDGIMEFCVESRPHPDFMGEKWFSDMRFILSEAKKRGMRVWVLDDRVFPTGFANGLAAKKYPQYLRKFMLERHMDAYGPMTGAAFHCPVNECDDEAVIAAVAMPNEPDGTAVVLNDKLRGSTLYWDVPDGLWRVYFIVTSRVGGNGKRDYINFLLKGGAQCLIEAVYEPHYEKFGDEFGKTFAGFFSDEPQFGNADGWFAKKARLGDYNMPLPYCDGLIELLSKEWGADFTPELPFLFTDTHRFGKKAAYCYMNTVTRLYADNFSHVLGKWCRTRGIDYVGHVIEDDGAHARLGMGTGHYFRALRGQSYAGIDVVLRQILPGRDCKRTRTASASTDCNGEFFHYTLAKLGSSLAHLNPNMRGRAFCEIFGAYGWSEGLKLMKWLADFMLVRGINYFVPHAYSMRECPDPDCPPHFYARGKNPQHKYFGILTRYMEKMCAIFSGGVHIASAAVLYHAEAEWYDKCMPADILAHELFKNQIDFDLIWADILENVTVESGKLSINGEEFGVLLVPHCAALPKRALLWITAAAKNGLPVIFAEDYPSDVCENIPEAEIQKIIDGVKAVCRVIPADKTAEEVKKLGLCDVTLETPHEYVRVYHYKKDGKHLYMLSNEHPHKKAECKIYFRESGTPVLYDVLNERHYTRPDGVLKLSPYESVMYVFGEKELPPREKSYGAPHTLNAVWRIEKADFFAPGEFSLYKEAAQLENIGAADALPEFSGTLKYKTTFKHGGGEALLDLGAVYETARVTINGKDAGVRICPPYTFPLENLLCGENVLEAEVTTTLANAVRDPFSCVDVFEPTGLIGPVTLQEKTDDN